VQGSLFIGRHSLLCKLAHASMDPIRQHWIGCVVAVIGL
jgi:hypothetical protein